MAVTLTIDDLEQPLGELDASLFPSGDIDNLVTAWLSQAITMVEANTGIATTDQAAAAAAWVYYRAYTQIADRFANTAQTIMVDGQVTRTTSADQRRWFAERATYWLDQYYGFNTLVALAAVPSYFGTVKAGCNVWPSLIG
jgi:hypothetical protein